MQYMLVQDNKKIAQEWEKYKGYTIRPLPSSLSYYNGIISAYSNDSSFMLYGGTPELRTIFQQLNYQATLVDRSAEMVKAMGLLTRAQRPLASNERFIQRDWLKLDNLQEQFDLLIGDDAINMVPWSDFEIFLLQARHCLRPGGLFICHLLVKPSDSLRFQKLSTLASEFRKGLIQSRFDLASRLNFLCWDEVSYAMGWQKTIQQLGEEGLALFKPDFNFIATFGLCNSQFYCPPQPLFEELIKPYFSIREIFYPHEHAYCLFEPVYVLEKK